MCLAVVFAMGAVSAQAVTIVPDASNSGDFGEVVVGVAETRSFAFSLETDAPLFSQRWSFGLLATEFQQTNLIGCSTGTACRFDITYTPLTTAAFDVTFNVFLIFTETKASQAGRATSQVQLFGGSDIGHGKPKPKPEAPAPGTVPLPAGGALLLTGLAGLAALRRHTTRRAPV